MSKKKAFVEQKTSELKEWKGELDDLKHKANDASGELKSKLDKQMIELQRLREEAGSRLKRVVEASEDAWESFNEDVEHTWKHGNGDRPVQRVYKRIPRPCTCS